MPEIPRGLQDAASGTPRFGGENPYGQNPRTARVESPNPDDPRPTAFVGKDGNPKMAPAPTPWSGDSRTRPGVLSPNVGESPGAVRRVVDKASGWWKARVAGMEGSSPASGARNRTDAASQDVPPREAPRPASEQRGAEAASTPPPDEAKTVELPVPQETSRDRVDDALTATTLWLLTECQNDGSGDTAYAAHMADGFGAIIDSRGMTADVADLWDRGRDKGFPEPKPEDIGLLRTAVDEYHSLPELRRPVDADLLPDEGSFYGFIRGIEEAFARRASGEEEFQPRDNPRVTGSGIDEGEKE